MRANMPIPEGYKSFVRNMVGDSRVETLHGGKFLVVTEGALILIGTFSKDGSSLPLLAGIIGTTLLIVHVGVAGLKTWMDTRLQS